MIVKQPAGLVVLRPVGNRERYFNETRFFTHAPETAHIQRCKRIVHRFDKETTA